MTSSENKTQGTIDLDLDTLRPEPKIVHLCGKELPVYPPRIKDIIRLIDLQKRVNEAEKTADFDMLHALKDALTPMMPGLDDPEVDITFEQLQVLIEFIMRMATPATVKEMQEKGITPAEPEKKTEDASDSLSS